NIQSREMRFLEEASKLGALCVRLWSDATIERLEGHSPKFSLEERLYFLNAIRYVSYVEICPDEAITASTLPCVSGVRPEVWAVEEVADNPSKRAYCAAHGIDYVVIPEASLREFPAWGPAESYLPGGRKKVIVTGCFDWFHSGHVRFFEETSQLGDLYVVVGHDENVRLLKGQGHPLFPEDERRYMAGAIRFVKQALISTGHGWMDAEPEIEAIKPDMYAVNEDGDQPAKREFCEKHGLKYVVLKRTPAAGLPRRESTHLRGF
ncbi:MAG: adenylyltransferase/cytidyltransferase family protein, partial [Anaerolineales bacterium]